MEGLTERQKFILTLVIHEFTRSAIPVASQTLVKRYHLDLSPATVRNEMAVLTELGYLRKPSKVAGSVPTEEGYRFFVGRLLRDTVLPEPEQRTISHQFYQMRQDMGQWIRLAASVLAYQARALSLVTAPHPVDVRLRHLELISTRGREILMIVVLSGGDVRQKIISSEAPIPQDQLSAIAQRLTHLMQGGDLTAIRVSATQLTGFDQLVAASLVEEMEDVERSATGEVFLDGVSHVLSEPEFAGSEDALRAIQLLEERSLLQDLVARSMVSERVGGVQVLIGGEGTREELRPFSMVLANYGAPGYMTGTLGVLGPMRMSYGRSISVVRFLSNLLSNMVTETIADDISTYSEEVEE